MQTFIAFPASQRLHENTQDFIDRMGDNPHKPDPKTMQAIMRDFTREALQTLFVMPSENIGLSPTMMKIIRGAVVTINGSSKQIVKRTAPKLDLAQNKEMASYMDLMRICTQGENGEDVWQVAFPLKPDLQKSGREGLALLADGKTAEARRALSGFLRALTDEGLWWYFEQPIGLLHLGPVLSRICKAGVETARKASKGVVHRVFDRLDEKELKEMAVFIDLLMVESEPRFPEQALQ